MSLLGRDKVVDRKSNADEQMALARLMDGTYHDIPGGNPTHLTAHTAYAPFVGTDTLAVLVEKNIFADFGDEGYARGYKWDSYVNSQFTKNEPPPKAA